MAFNMPPYTSVTLGVGFPGQGTLAIPLVTTAPRRFRSTNSPYSIPDPKVPEQVITGFPEIVPHYQIVLTTKGTLDHVELRVETAPDFSFDEIRALEDLRRRLAAELKSNLQIAVDIKIVEPKTIARSEGKAKRVIDQREGK